MRPSTAACSFKRVARSDVNVVFWDFSDRHLFTSNNEYLYTHYWVMTCPELTQMPGVHKQIYFMSGHATLKISLASNCKTAQSLQQVCGERAIYPSLAVCYQQKSKIVFQRSRSAWPKLTDSCKHLGRMFSELRQMTRLSPNSIEVHGHTWDENRLSVTVRHLYK